MNQISSVELYTGGECLHVISKEDVFRAFPQNDRAFLERDWETACEYLSGYASSNGICRLNLDAALEGSTLDYAKNSAVFLLFTALMESGAIHKVPLQLSKQALPFLSARMATAEMDMVKHRRMDDFVRRAAREMEDALQNDIPVDEVFAQIFTYIPSVKSFASVMEPDRERYLPFFEMLYEKSQACADPHYPAELEAYLETLEGEIP